MAKIRKVSFLAKKTVPKRVSFKAHGKKVSFIAKVPSERRVKVSFYIKKKK